VAIKIIDKTQLNPSSLQKVCFILYETTKSVESSNVFSRRSS